MKSWFQCHIISDSAHTASKAISMPYTYVLIRGGGNTGDGGRGCEQGCSESCDITAGGEEEPPGNLALQWSTLCVCTASPPVHLTVHILVLDCAIAWCSQLGIVHPPLSCNVKATVQLWSVMLCSVMVGAEFNKSRCRELLRRRSQTMAPLLPARPFLNLIQ